MSTRTLGHLLIALICLSIVFYFTLVIGGVLFLSAIYGERVVVEEPQAALEATAAPEEDEVPGEIRIAKLRGVDPSEFFQPIGSTAREPMGSLLNRALAGDWSPRDLQQLARRRKDALTELTLLYEGTADTTGRVRIVEVMNQLGDRSIRNRLARELRDAPPEEQLTALERMRISYLWKGDFTHDERELLTELAHHGPEEHRGKFVALLAGDPESAGTALELFDFIPQEQQTEIAWRMAADERANLAAVELLGILETSIHEASETDWIVAMEALLNLSRHSKDQTGSDALKRAEVEFWKRKDEVRYDPRVARAWFQAARTTSSGVLRDIESNAPDPTARGYAFAALARLKGIDALPSALERLQQKEGAFGGYLALSELRRSGNEEAVETALAGTPPAPPSEDLVKFMIERGDAEALEWATDQLDSLAPLQQMQVAWLRNRFRLENLAIALEKEGLTPRPVDLMALRTQSGEPGGLPVPDHQLVWEYLNRAGLARTIHLDTTGQPVPHDELVMELADFSKGDLDLIHWEQAPRPDGEGYQVRFIYQEDVYEFPVRNLGKQFDLTRVLEALNAALINSRRTERFLRVDLPGSPSHVVYGQPGQWEAIEKQFAIPVVKPPTPVLRREASL